MSTFNGFVKEFPTVRIDYFRTLPGKPAPAACFLSHVHSDHILGLESLKMPFVYCSATTRRLLLRMEKYPHRINFAKGILESRRQHYRHLKLVLKALPLYTSVELELAPKSKIRVTLLDANHCPGSVMFLIEDDNQAILYTGDVRAELWWVNALIQNPLILRYTCGYKELDCIYLDTTFSTHDDQYRNFPTKREGLTELITKVSQCSRDAVFYFRAWTLGYEQVWMALSNLLRCPIHVDEYQLNLFAGIVENGQDGYSMFEGPSLSGCSVGNHYHPGCLSGESETRLHSCEPGSKCHASLTNSQNVVWITPIISRLSDGTELLELGAGGGMNDLYQTSTLELFDSSTLDAVHVLLKGICGVDDEFEKIEKVLKQVQQSGEFRLSLDSLGLEVGKNIPLKEFVDRISKSDDVASLGLRGECLTSEKLPKPRNMGKVIHFPFSRHSSHQELRHLVSAFRPKDICPCTVYLETWSEDTSMRYLFGDLCSRSTFYHDAEISSQAQELRDHLKMSRSLKRKHADSSQKDENERNTPPSQNFVSAPMTAESKQFRGDGAQSSSDTQNATKDSLSQRPLLPPSTSQSLRNTAEPLVCPASSKLEHIQNAFHALNKGSDLIAVSRSPQQVVGRSESPDDSQQYLSLSDCELKVPRKDCSADRLTQLDGVYDDSSKAAEHSVWSHHTRLATRKEACTVATRALLNNEYGGWDDLNLRSLGRTGHEEEEPEL
jgi:hypothetical protein